MNYAFSYRIFPLGDSALTLDFGNSITESVNKEVISLFHNLQQQPFTGMIEVIPAYSSLTIYYDVIELRKSVPAHKSVFDLMKEKLETFLTSNVNGDPVEGKEVMIPVCYDDELGYDLDFISEKTNLSKEEIIQLHTSTRYRVFMLGFLPGFPYMGKTDKKIAIARKEEPQMVEAGSVAIAGRQTGIYSMNSPGGWHIIGRTTTKLFDSSSNDVTLLKPGDTVRFYPISKEEYFNQAYEPESD